MTGPVATFHDPVMVNEVLAYLQPRSGTIVDATVGGGGHARAILSALAGGEFGTAPAEQSVAGSPAERGTAGGRRFASGLLGFDRDPEALASARARLGEFENVELVHASYLELASRVQAGGYPPVTGVLFDLGVSLHQLVTAERGFSFDSSGPIDMRFDPTADEPTALALIRRAGERELRSWLREFGEEPMSGRVARCIHERRGELRTTGDLAQVATWQDSQHLQ
jgi:16S rRNA (cytosine1402-N4)-methyltransferase